MADLMDPGFHLEMLMPLLVPAALVLYSTTAHYQRPTLPLLFDSLAFTAGLGLWLTLALHAPNLPLRLALILPVVGFLAIFFVGNKMCYRFFKDWAHHQMLLEWRVGGSILRDVFKELRAWEWIGGFGLTLAAALLCAMYGRPAPLHWAVPIGLGLLVVGAVGHAALRSRCFETDEHNPFMNFVRGWLNEFKGVNEKRATAIAPLVRPAPGYGYRDAAVPGFPLVNEPRSDLPPRPRLTGPSGRPPNIVLVILESVRALECGAYGAAPSFTPKIDALSRDGLLFKNFYANGSQTVRGEMALLCSYYDHYGGSPLYVRCPGLRLRSLPEILRDHGYQTHWISSYTAAFHNKENFLRGHGIDEIHDDRGLPPGLPTINWGPSDEDLFSYATTILDRQTSASDGGGRPFFAEIMTLTNHWPFAGPYPTSDQTPVVCRDKLYTDFTRGVYYTDHAVGRFIDSVRDKPWFDDTIFVFTSDHGAWIYPDELGLNALQKQEAYFRMPMLFYAPAMVDPGVVQGVTSQVDFAPTLLDLLGLRERNAFVGRSAFDPIDPAERRALMLHWHSWNVRVGDRYLYTVGKSFQSHHNRAARPDDTHEKRGTTYAYFEEHDDLLRKRDASSVEPRTGPEVDRLTAWAEDLLYLTEFLRVHNRVYDRPIGAAPPAAERGCDDEPVASATATQAGAVGDRIHR